VAIKPKSIELIDRVQHAIVRVTSFGMQYQFNSVAPCYGQLSGYTEFLTWSKFILILVHTAWITVGCRSIRQ